MGMGCGVLDKGNKEKGKGTKFIAKSEWRIAVWGAGCEVTGVRQNQ